MESIRRMFITGTIAFAITVSSGIWSNTASAHTLISIDELESQKMLLTGNSDIGDELHRILGLDSDEDLHEATYTHQSLAEIADIQQVDVQKIITLQTSQLMEQVDERLAKGYLTLHEYGALTAEIPEIIRKSVYGETS